MFWPVRILDRRTRLLASEEIPQVLIEWQEGGQEGATWEDVATIQEQYPEFNLGVKVVGGEGSNVRELIIYKRRRKAT
ncbi:hypothetical protein LR48_Vigan04g179800 [Vigna angularis]|uniref:Chromo domain-containing protein n=1 Tax=Phaseolus angularis TaxID=3914 RepID=A0A0L9UFD0_PHAAN|nr:hypothetical protein LR48_Vigan04g179800 [Vigna angularis]